ncbi:CvpA family protein [Dehalogenimonas sp. 4OHTPN]|uniref:CvpA family protein n=1 Tax=Dehalogenimonas sp. 4OHTPN TaxID=3166643 RepID=A0AAU8GAX3_9CHLR
MNWLDIALLVFLAFQVFSGLSQGLIKALGGLLGLIVGIFLAGRFYESLGGSVFSFISNEDIANAAAFAAVLIVTWIVFSIIAGLLTKLVSVVLLGWVNRLAGAIFGLFMGTLIAGAALAVWAQFFGGESLADSTIATFLLDKFPLVLSLLPSQFDSIKEFFQ